MAIYNRRSAFGNIRSYYFCYSVIWSIWSSTNEISDKLLGYNLVPRIYILKVTIWEFLFGGMIIGALASIISMRNS